MKFEFSPDKEEFKELIKRYTVVPVSIQLPCDLDTPISLFYKVARGRYDFLLESVEGAEKWARYSFIGTKPFLVFKSKANKVVLERFEGGKEKREEVFKENPFEYLREIFEEFSAPLIPGAPRFLSGAVGYIGYETVRFFERIPYPEDTLGFWDMCLIFPEVVLVYDRFSHSLRIVYNVRRKKGFSEEELFNEAKEVLVSFAEKLREKSVIEDEGSLEFEVPEPTPEISKQKFLSMVEKAKHYIKEGDVIQVVLSQRFFLESKVPPFLIYRALRKVNPSPYLFFLRLEDEYLIGSSPEILVRMEGKLVETRPIAGTRKRGKTEEEDRFLEEELKSDEKERAEHMMLVDLGRNDIGRVCEYGSVEVYELMVVERYSHVMHLVSGVRGRAKPGVDMFDVFSACFPAGTVSGAPKIRAMEIIAELEEKVRGPYAGAVGYFDFSGGMDFCITIRTLFQKGDKLFIQAGAGIVADSVPEKEYEETINKAKAIFKALKLVKHFA